ncbi:MAG: ATP-binding protein [bacterium]|nr:ATP-binding protein [bacterium]
MPTFIEISILFFSVAVNLALLGFVYTRNPNSATHRLFALLALIISLWTITNFYSYNISDPLTAIWLVRGVMFFATPLSVTFFLLMHTYPRATMSLSKKAVVIWSFLTLITMAIAISPLLFTRVELTLGSAPKPTPGPGMILFIPIGIGTIPLGMFYLFKKWRRAAGIEKVQLNFLLIGVLIMFGLIISFNFVAVNAFNSTLFIPYAALFVLPFTLLTSYTIIRHRLMDIRLAIARSLSFSFLVGGFFVIYGAVLVFAVPYLATILNIPETIIAAIGALLSVVVARYVQAVLRRVTDKFLFQRQADYRAALVKIGQRLSRTIQINEVTDIILQSMQKVVRTERVVIFLQDQSKQHFFASTTRSVKLDRSIPRSHLLVKHLSHSQNLTVKDELPIIIESTKRPEVADELKAVQKNMEWLDASVVMPLFVDKGLTGFIVLGDKLSGQPYLHEDIEFLSALAPQAATSLENARLYKESLEFGEKLKTEVKRATHELEIANQQLKDLDKAKSEFLSIASHQLYTPLTALRGYISMMMEGDFGKLSTKQEPIMDILNKSAMRLIELIKNLLDISRIESGRLQLNLESIDLSEMAKEMVQNLMPNAMTKKLKLEYHEPSHELPHVIADRERIRQVTLNFIDNSIKYTDQGSIDVSVKQEGDELVFEVTDTGKGIAADEITKLFTKFTRVGDASKYHTEGTGLGLYVARQIIREHHGDVEVKSPGKDRGSTFIMRVPIEGAPKSLKLGDKATVVIKAAEAQGAAAAKPDQPAK